MRCGGTRNTIAAKLQAVDPMRKLMSRILQTGLICALLAACGGASDTGPDADPEDALRAWVEAAESRAEDKDRSGLLAMISESYADPRGNDHEKIGNIIHLLFMRQQNVAILTSIDDIEVMGDTAAHVSLTVGMAGTDASALGIRANAYNFELELENPGDEWMLIGARWGKVGRDAR